MSQCLAVLAVCAVMVLGACKVSVPGKIETYAARKTKKATIGGKDWKNPVPDTAEAVKLGEQHFQHHCQICHGLDGHATGVPFADKLSPPVPDLGNEDTQAYTDGQLKWITENGIRFTGMPAWEGILKDEEMWHIVRSMRHLPPKGSLGIPSVFKAARAHE